MLKLNFKQLVDLLVIATSEEIGDEIQQLEGQDLLNIFDLNISHLEEYFPGYPNDTDEFVSEYDLENKVYLTNLYKSIKTYLSVNNVTDQEITDELVEEVINGLNNRVFIDSFGGEGEGDTIWRIVKFETYGIYIKISGYYDSYNGTDWDDISEVFPFVQISTEYSGYKSNWTIEQLKEKLEETYKSIN